MPITRWKWIPSPFGRAATHYKEVVRVPPPFREAIRHPKGTCHLRGGRRLP
jgi:hypothetical protein